MSDLNEIRIAGGSMGEFLNSFSRACRSLPRELGIKLRDIHANYFAKFGMEATRERMNHRTVAEIFSEFDQTPARPIAAGEHDGVRYELFEQPTQPPNGDNSGTSTD